MLAVVWLRREGGLCVALCFAVVELEYARVERKLLCRIQLRDKVEQSRFLHSADEREHGEVLKPGYSVKVSHFVGHSGGTQQIPGKLYQWWEMQTLLGIMHNTISNISTSHPKKNMLNS